MTPRGGYHNTEIVRTPARVAIGDRVRVMFNGEDYLGTIKAEGTRAHQWYVLPDGKSRTELVSARLMERIATPEKVNE